MRGGCEGRSGDDSGAKQSRGRSSPSRESVRQGSRFQTSASTPICTRVLFSFFLFPLAPSRHCVFTVIKSVIKAPFVCLRFHLSLWVAADRMYNVLLRVHPYIVYAHVCICVRAGVLLRGPCNESSVSVFKQEVEDKLAQRDTRAHRGQKFLIARRRRRRRRRRS